MFWPLFSARGLEQKLVRCEAAHNREAVSAVVLEMPIVDPHQNRKAKIPVCEILLGNKPDSDLQAYF